MSYKYKKISKRLLNNFSKEEEETTTSPKLVKTQIELILFLAKGFTLKEIAQKNNCTLDNIKKRTHKLYKKFKVNSRKKLIEEALSFKFIQYKDISNKFRNRFFNIKKRPTTDNLGTKINGELTQEEIKVLILAAVKLTKKEIIKKLSFPNMHYCNYVFYEIFKKLETKNITNSILKAIKLGIIIPEKHSPFFNV